MGTALGFDSGLEFQAVHLTLDDGDAVIFYTDGVTEAFDPARALYGSDRLLSDASGSAGQGPRAITAGLLAKVREFAGTAPQSDDIAILTFKIDGATGTEARA